MVLDCDIVVLGGGTSGCVVAGRLAGETDARVVVLEAGPDPGPREGGGWPADLLDGGALATSHDWGYDTGSLHPLRGPIELQRARVIGGCSSHNGCVAAVGCPADYDAWAELVGDAGWGAEGLRPLIGRALERMRVRLYDENEIGPFHRSCLEAAAALGLARADDLHDLDGGVGFGVEPVNIVDGVRFNTAFAYLDPARDRLGLRVVDRVLCDRIALEGDGVVAIGWRDGEEVRVRAATAVLSAGAYGSPAILLRSGVGASDEMRTLGIDVVHELPGVGRNLHDHPLVEVEHEGSDELRRRLAEASVHGFVPEEQTLGKLRSSHATGPYDLHVMPVAAHERSLLAGRTILGVSAMEPRSRGRVTLRSRDPDDPPILDHGYLSDPDGLDVAVLAEGIERVRELAATEPLRSLLGAETVPGPGANLGEAIPRVFAHYFHPVGTCALGPASDPLAVCDARARLHGLERIVVADCSLMPVVPRANTNIPAVVVGERVADLLIGSRSGHG